jgi:hypothetical protein
MILGLDASCSCCGWSFFDGITVIDAGFIDTSKLQSNKEKAFFILNTLSKNQYYPLITGVNLEAALSGFMGGRTSQQVIIKLARFNAVLEYIIGEHLKVPVILVGASTARKKVLGKAFIKGMTAKEWVKQEIPKHFPDIQKYIKLNKQGNYDKRNEDMLDAVVMSCAK